MQIMIIILIILIILIAEWELEGETLRRWVGELGILCSGLAREADRLRGREA